MVRGLSLIVAGAVAISAGAAPQVVVTTTARAVQPGELAILTLAFTEPATDVRVVAFDRTLSAHRLDDRTWQVLVGIDLDTKPATYTVRVEAGPIERVVRAEEPLVVVAKTFPTRRLTVDPAFVNPPPAALARIERDNRVLSEMWASSAAERLWEGPFVRPVPHPANSAFGTRSVFNGQPRNAHNGADFLSPTGTPIKAPNAGRIVLAEDLYYSGGTVAVDHGQGLISLFAHLSAIDVARGDAVVTGQTIGKVGATGRVTGAHLHWTLRAHGARVDPLSLLAVLGSQVSQ